jgi:perosamine synthetase
MSSPEMPDDFLPISRVVLAGNEERYVVDAVRSTWLSVGSYVQRFEADFAAFLDAPHAVSVCNGTCALDLALAALGIGPGDEVIVPSLTFAASINAVMHVGAEPVLVDSSPDHWDMDPRSWEGAITGRTKAVMPVHLYGHPCDMRPILEIARRKGLFVVEDAAEAHGAKVMGRTVGTLGDVGCFSFYGNKIITTGEGGMCVTKDPEIDRRLRNLRDHGMRPERRYWHEEVGFNFRLTNLSAAVGVAQLEAIDRFLARRREIGLAYATGLGGVPGLTIFPQAPVGEGVDWLFCAFFFEGGEAERDDTLRALREAGIDGRPTFYPAHTMPPYRELRRYGDLANAERFGHSGINLPLHPAMTDGEVERAISTLKQIASRGRTTSGSAGGSAGLGIGPSR